MRLKIDGKDVEVPPGIMVKDAAKRAGIKIPGLCDHEDLEPYGGCRLCLVEIEGIRGYPSSCTMPISEGMVVRTDTQTLRKLRLGILEMLLSEHPCICLTCERSGKCDEIREGMRKTPQSMGCRYCPKDRQCELQDIVEEIGLKKMDLPHLGDTKEVVRSPFFDRDPNLCILCGRCIRACLDRGLGVISFIFRGFEAGIGTAFEKPLQDSNCRFCGACVDVCPTGALMERAGKWAGVPDEKVATFCPYCGSNCQIDLDVGKGRLIRANSESSKLCVRGRFGLGFVDQNRITKPLIKKDGKLIETSWEDALDCAVKGLSRHRKDRFALFASGVLPNEALYMAKKFASQVMMGHAVAPDQASIDCRAEDLSGPIIVLGDLAETNPATELALRSHEPIVISPLGTLLARQASLWLRPKPGEEALLLSRLAGAMNGKIEASISVSSDEIQKAAEKLQGASVVVGPDCGPEVRASAHDLALATGGKLCLLGKNCNSRGAVALGLNLEYKQMLNALLFGNLKAAYIAGWNPVRVQPELAKPLSALDYLVVQDIFLTETAKLADVVFPAASFAEIEGTFLGPMGQMLPLREATQPLGKPDWQILAELGRRMGAEGFDYCDSGLVAKEMLASGLSNRSDPKPEAFETKEPPKKMPLLLQGPSLFQFGSGTRTSKVFDLQYLTRMPQMEINPKDAREIGLEPYDPLLIDWNEGNSRAFAKISSRVPPGVFRISGIECGVYEARVRKDE
jgi:predicted molibdopterin-dependent oxidoreductase YjgC